ncbi:MULTISPECIES: hypothetical protein [Parabacteroides]|uniref:Uncharacterized protein n=4 Tax=Tannerellaceae TaxID=2005525 RepID=A0A413N7Z5_9BACT|nr:MULTISPECIES: hypothetical protein [Parabacteroides]MBC5631515.1 hypothetical protein [Parabacteroides hominis]RGZ44654.1 hypothetical protein DW986_16465 [Parabacteroides merdae]
MDSIILQIKYGYAGITNPMTFINGDKGKIENLLCPEYYKNEVNAYSAEIRLNPSVSEKYALERLYMLWKQEALYNYSLKYYKY